MTPTELVRLVEFRTWGRDVKLELQNGRCFWCKEPVAWKPEVYQKVTNCRMATKEHLFSVTDPRRIMPGGLYWVVACTSCNNKRSNKTTEGRWEGKWEYTPFADILIKRLEQDCGAPSRAMAELEILRSQMTWCWPDYLNVVEMHFRRQAMREERGWL